MRYLITYDASQPSGDRLRRELVRLRADPLNRWTWLLETHAPVAALATELVSFVEDADSLVIVDITDRHVALVAGPDHTLVPEVGATTHWARPLAARPGEQTS